MSGPPAPDYPPTASYPTAAGHQAASGYPATAGFPATENYPATAAYPETPGYAASPGYPAASPAAPPYPSAPPYASAPPYPPAPNYPATPFVGAGQRPRRRGGRWAATAAFLAVLLVGGALLVPKLLPGQGGQQGLPDTAGEPRGTNGPRPGGGAVETPGAALTQPGGDAGASPPQYDPNPPGSGPRPTRSSAAPGGYPAGDATPGAAATAGTTGVVYEIKASGTGNTGRLYYRDKDGEAINLDGIELPWRLAFVPVDIDVLSVSVRRSGGGNAGPLTCTITVDGKLRSSTTDKGRNAYVHCSALL